MSISVVPVAPRIASSNVSPRATRAKTMRGTPRPPPPREQAAQLPERPRGAGQHPQRQLGLVAQPPRARREHRESLVEPPRHAPPAALPVDEDVRDLVREHL